MDRILRMAIGGSATIDFKATKDKTINHVYKNYILWLFTDDGLIMPISKLGTLYDNIQLICNQTNKTT